MPIFMHREWNFKQTNDFLDQSINHCSFYHMFTINSVKKGRGKWEIGGEETSEKP